MPFGTPLFLCIFYIHFVVAEAMKLNIKSMLVNSCAGLLIVLILSSSGFSFWYFFSGGVCAMIHRSHIFFRAPSFRPSANDSHSCRRATLDRELFGWILTYKTSINFDILAIGYQKQSLQLGGFITVSSFAYIKHLKQQAPIRVRFWPLGYL